MGYYTPDPSVVWIQIATLGIIIGGIVLLMRRNGGDDDDLCP